MMVFMAILIGFLFAVSIYLLLRRSIVKLVFGLLFMSYAANLLLFVTGGLVTGKPAFVKTATQLETISDPLPQALILTAIVIGFGVAAFAMVLIYRFHRETGTVDMDELSETNSQ